MNRRRFFGWFSALIGPVFVFVTGKRAKADESSFERYIEYRVGKDSQLEWRHVWLKRPQKIKRTAAEIAEIKELDAKLRALDELPPPPTPCEICDEIVRVIMDAELKGARVRFHGR